tara:strand:- start:1552 stop:2565 length:1014 start_codon:yes stop_codon:yes gene_type:complete
LVIELTKETLAIPDDYLVAIVPGSNTGAFETALWSMLGPLPVDALTWESFGSGWVYDIEEQLALKDVRVLSARYGDISNLSNVRENSDICFTWNGTTSGVRVPNADWISENRIGMTFCDATSAIFAQELAWKKLDVTTFSWQKAMGGEGGHGVLILSPKAISRLREFVPDRPIPKIFRLGKEKVINFDLFQGKTINTPSMLCVADALDSLLWIKKLGGWKATCERSSNNFQIVSDWYSQREWITNLVKRVDIQSNSSVCLQIIDRQFLELSDSEKWEFINEMTSILEQQEAAFDIKSHRDAPPGLRIWCGPTVETEDLRRLLPWLDWSFQYVKTKNF